MVGHAQSGVLWNVDVCPRYRVGPSCLIVDLVDRFRHRGRALRVARDSACREAWSDHGVRRASNKAMNGPKNEAESDRFSNGAHRNTLNSTVR